MFCKQEGLEFPTVENCDSLKFCRLALKPFYEATLKVGNILIILRVLNSELNSQDDCYSSVLFQVSRTDESAGLVLFVYQVLVDHANRCVPSVTMAL